MIANPKVYSAMKDSGIEWLGDVPAHWEIRRLRTIAEMRVSNVDKHTKEEEFPIRLCNYADVYKNDRITPAMPFMNATASQDEIEKFHLEKGDVLITKDSETWDDIGVPALVAESADNLLSGYHLALLRPFREALGAYLARTLQSKAVAYQFHVRANGVTRYGLTHTGIQSVRIPIPSLAEQTAIVRFLDHADRRIRRYIRAKQKLIALLEEQKQAIIHQVVAGQIDVRTGQPYSSYKDSSVERLGEVPAHWEIMRLKQLSRIQGGFAFSTDSFGNEGIPVVRMNNIRRGLLGLYDVVRIPEDKCKNAFALNEGDIIYGLSGSIGATGSLGNYAVVRRGDVPAQLNQRIARFRPITDRITEKFLVGSLQTRVFYEQVLSYTTGTAQFNVSTNDIGNVVLALPPIKEQRAIVARLDKATASIDVAIERTRRQIELVEEYRTRLIADIVTGKLDVREAAAKLPEIDPLATESDEDDTPDTEAESDLDEINSVLEEAKA